ncbi:unnamed protein product [Albugo candida]|uniref:Uncharacterized protein n=1 Tax=Albugo candida TaxID=65357 RepID=A0A024GEI9_9STRA|nr:unnamed protein product [Albugo candida]|eukprot:CCI45294.1 unnamed protein product [Albugo candida]
MSKIGIALQFLHFDLLSYLHMLSLVRSPRLSADEVPLIVSAGTGLTVARYLFSKYLTEHPLQSGCKETLVVTARKEGFQCARNLRKIVCLFLSPNRPILSPSSNNQEVHGRKVERVRLGSLQVIFDKVQMQSSIIRHDVVCVLNVSPVNSCLALKEAYHYVHFGAFEVALRLDHRDSHLIACTSNARQNSLWTCISQKEHFKDPKSVVNSLNVTQQNLKTTHTALKIDFLSLI